MVEPLTRSVRFLLGHGRSRSPSNNTTSPAGSWNVWVDHHHPVRIVVLGVLVVVLGAVIVGLLSYVFPELFGSAPTSPPP